MMMMMMMMMMIKIKTEDCPILTDVSKRGTFLLEV